MSQNTNNSAVGVSVSTVKLSFVKVEQFWLDSYCITYLIQNRISLCKFIFLIVGVVGNTEYINLCKQIAGLFHLAYPILLPLATNWSLLYAIL